MLAVGLLAATKKQGPPPKRAKPPKWSADVLDTFFPDARTKLVGERPQYDKATAVASVQTPSEPAASTAAVEVAATGTGWSKLIDAETIETEIKRLAADINKDVATPAPFKGGGYKDCRRHFSVLAAMFGVAAEYDGDVRWKDGAASLRDLFARAGRNCKVGTDQSFQEATQRKQELADLVSGNRPKPSDADPKADWPQVSDRPPLMQRLNIAQLDRLQPWLGSKGEFAAHQEDIKHEAQLAAAIADIITREGYEFADDDTYVGYANELKQAASDLSSAVDLNNFDQARAAYSKATKSCADCHEGYRQ